MYLKVFFYVIAATLPVKIYTAMPADLASVAMVMVSILKLQVSV